MDTEAFVHALHRDLAHRKQELTRIKLSLQEIDDDQLHTWMSRAAAVLSYSHWEGFVKVASMRYLKFINDLQLPVRSLKTCFQAAVVVSHFKRAENSRKIGHLAQLLVDMDGKRAGAFNVNPLKVVDTEHNLSSTVFVALVAGLGLEPMPEFAARIGFIDATLLNGRNQVAHGELLFVPVEDAIARIDGVTRLLDAYADQLIEAVEARSYLALTEAPLPRVAVD